jgi:GTP-binding protein
VFIDEVLIRIRSGRGGDGRCSFRREKFAPKGGPDGGDGGRGGDVVLVADPHLDTLHGYARRRIFAAQDGEAGGGGCRHGADGESLELAVPVGCLVYDEDGGDLLADLVEPGQRLLAAAGGRGGLGNERFKNSVQQAPTQTTPGEPAVERRLRLELKLLADAGLVGLPNAGKSTFLRSISRATPKVADYPFTTLSPQLGIAELPGDRRLLVADVPGLIEHAAAGAGLGHEFLRHLERTAVLIHLVDAAPLDDRDPVRDYEVIRGELASFSEALASKPEIVVLNKVDLLPDGDGGEREERLRSLRSRLPENATVLRASGGTGEGVSKVLEAAWSLVEASRSRLPDDSPA